jgi:hypothetical protein
LETTNSYSSNNYYTETIGFAVLKEIDHEWTISPTTKVETAALFINNLKKVLPSL